MSDNKRETRDIKVGEHTVTVHTYVTGRELREIEGAILNDLQITQKGAEQEVAGFNGKMLQARQDAQIKSVVVAIDGVHENVLDLVLDLNAPLYGEIMEYVREVTEPKKVLDDKPKQSPTT